MKLKYTLTNGEMAYIKTLISDFSKLSPFHLIIKSDGITPLSRLNMDIFTPNGQIKSETIKDDMTILSRPDKFLSIIMGNQDGGGVISLYSDSMKQPLKSVCCVLAENGFEISGKIEILRILDYINAFCGQNDEEDIYFEMSCSIERCLVFALFIDFVREKINTGEKIEFSLEEMEKKWKRYSMDSGNFISYLKNFLFWTKNNNLNIKKGLEDFVKMGSINLIDESGIFKFDKVFFHALLYLIEFETKYFFLRISRDYGDNFSEGSIGVISSGEYFLMIEPHIYSKEIVKIIITGGMRIKKILSGAVINPDIWLNEDLTKEGKL